MFNVNAAYKLYQSGKSTLDVAQVYDVKPTDVTNQFRKAGLKLRSAEQTREMKQKENGWDKEQAKALYSEGKTMAEIASRFKITSATLSRRLTKDGVQKRSNRKYQLNENLFQGKLTEQELYVLGLALSDGCVSANGKNWRFSIGLKLSDIGLLGKLKVFFQTDKPLSVRPNHAILNLDSNTLCQRLIALGVTERKSLTAKVPEHLVDEVDLWRGLIDGDGHLCKAKGSLWVGSKRISMGLTGSRDITSQFADFVERKGLRRPTVTKCPNSNAYKVSISGHVAQRIATLLYHDGATLSLKRKREKAEYFKQWRPRNEDKHFAYMPEEVILRLTHTNQRICQMLNAGWFWEDIALELNEGKEDLRKAYKEDVEWSLCEYRRKIKWENPNLDWREKILQSIKQIRQEAADSSTCS